MSQAKTSTSNDLEKGLHHHHEHQDETLPVPRPDHAAPGAHLANAVVLGLWSFASTTFTLCMYLVGARDIVTPNAVVGMTIGVGGLAQFVAGMWLFPTGNTYAATAFSSYGGFWFSFALLYIPGTGIADAYATTAEFNNAIGIYLVAWAVVTFFFLVCSLRKAIALIVVFFTLEITFILLAAANMTGSHSVQLAGGAFGLMTAFSAWYTGFSMILSAEDRPVIRLPLGIL